MKFTEIDLQTEELDLSGQITSLKGIERLQNLRKLDIRDCVIKDYSPLAALVKLTDLTAGDSYKTINLDFLQYTPNLTRFITDHPLALKDIKGLEHTPKLKRLSLHNAYIDFIEPLKYLEDLELLDLSATWIKNVKPLKGLKKLRKIYLDQTSFLENIDALCGKPLEEITLNDSSVMLESLIKVALSLTEEQLNACKIIVEDEEDRETSFEMLDGEDWLIDSLKRIKPMKNKEDGKKLRLLISKIKWAGTDELPATDEAGLEKELQRIISA